MLSPLISTSTNDGASLQPPTSPRRRGLSYLRGLSQSRISSSNNTSTEAPRVSPRSYFNRSISYTEPHNLQPGSSRRRSVSRPNETSTRPSQSTGTAENPTTRALSPPPAIRRSQSHSRAQVAGLTPDISATASGAEEMARQRTGSGRRATSSRTDAATTGSRTTTDSIPGQPQALRSNRQASSRNTSGTNGTGQEAITESKMPLPTIRFYPHQEQRNGRQSLNFAAVSRTLPADTAIIRVGRYSEREGVPTVNPTTPSDAPVGFKSKVVSRKHCEFSFVDGQWQIKDVASSSGTFLNHVRLSQPNVESRLFPVKDGDIVQLGIDFRGGEEMIFRCVKIRVECNRTWQKRPNNFNKTRHAQLQSLSKDQPTADENSGECSICLGAVLPCQSLFVAPCAHVWHYKCIRPLLEGHNSTYPQFQCPNCRAYTDLSAEVEFADDMDNWQQNGADGEDDNESAVDEPESEAANGIPTNDDSMDDVGSQEAAAIAAAMDTSEQDVHPQAIRNYSRGGTNNNSLLDRRQEANPNSPEIRSVNSIDIPTRVENVEADNELQPEITRTASSPNPEDIISGEGPLTPRNNAGPWVFDGSAGRASGRRLTVPGLSE